MNINNENNNEEHSDLVLQIKDFFVEDLIIKDANEYKMILKNGYNFTDFANILMGLSTIQKTCKADILINDLSIKNDSLARVYFQQNTLILSDNLFLNQDLSLIDNIKIISYLYTGFDLSKAVLSSFSMKEYANILIKNLSKEQQQMVLLSYCVCCPANIWIVNSNLLKNLSDQNLEIFENSIKIRIKHGGIVIKI